MTISLFHNYPNSDEKLNIFETFCIAISAIFGMSIKDANDENSSTCGRLSLFTVFICGSLFFYTYGGFLTSSLAVPNEKFPFNSPEGILKTNYR